MFEQGLLGFLGADKSDRHTDDQGGPRRAGIEQFQQAEQGSGCVANGDDTARQMPDPFGHGGHIAGFASSSGALAHGITINSHNSLAADYAVFLPAALPGAQHFLSLDASGNIAADWVVDNSTIVVSSNTVKVPTGGITGTQIASNVNLPGNAVQENGNNVVVANTNATNSFAIMRGGVVGVSGATAVGEGWGVSSHPSAGTWIIGFNTTLGDVPTIVISGRNGAGDGLTFWTALEATTGFTAKCANLAGTGTDADFSFIVLGQRA